MSIVSNKKRRAARKMIKEGADKSGVSFKEFKNKVDEINRQIIQGMVP